MASGLLVKISYIAYLGHEHLENIVIVNNDFCLGDIITNKCAVIDLEKHVGKCSFFFIVIYIPIVSLKKINIEHLIVNVQSFEVI